MGAQQLQGIVTTKIVLRVAADLMLTQEITNLPMTPGWKIEADPPIASQPMQLMNLALHDQQIIAF